MKFGIKLVLFILAGIETYVLVNWATTLKKESPLIVAGFQSISSFNYSGEIASVGQTSAQEPQSVQRSASIL